MNILPVIISLIVVMGLPTLAQIRDYDSRTNLAPHVFDWDDAYERVSIRDGEGFQISGGFMGGLHVLDSASGMITAGDIRGIHSRGVSSLLVLGVATEYINAQDQARIDIYGCEQPVNGQILAGGNALIRIFGGNCGRVYSWSDGGRVEVFGRPLIQSLNANSTGVVLQNGGETYELAAARTGISVLDDGVVRNRMSAIEQSTLVIAGGNPPPEIRMFDDSRLIILEDQVGGPDYAAYRASDFDEEGSKEFTVMLDGFFRSFRVSGPDSKTFRWRGIVEVARIGHGMKVFKVGVDSMMVAFRAPGDQVLQMEFSRDLTFWQPWKSAILGDWKIHVDVIRTGDVASCLFFRLRKWSKPDYR